MYLSLHHGAARTRYLQLLLLSQSLSPRSSSTIFLRLLQVCFIIYLSQFFQKTYIQKMGACECSATKNSAEEKEHQLQENSALPENDSVLQGHSQNEKRRVKNALILGSGGGEALQDNVEYNSEWEITPNDIAEIKKALGKHFIFGQLPDGQIDCFIKEMKPCSAARKTYIFRQGDQSGSYYIILEGVCQVEINSQKKRTLTFGDSFGDLGIVYNAPRSASILALTDCQMVEINRTIFKKVMDDINHIYQKENRKFLSVLSFFKDLTEQQKNAIASACLSENYQQGQIIFNKGDDANSFYVIKEGVVTDQEANFELKAGDCFGENSILVEGGFRSKTLQAKTTCKIISMSRQNIKTSLGDSIKNIITRNITWRVVTQSRIYDCFDTQKLREAVDSCEFLLFNKGETVLRKEQEHSKSIFVVLNTSLKGETVSYPANSVVEARQLLNKKCLVIKEDMVAMENGCLCRLQYEFETAPTPLSIQFRNAQQQMSQREERTAIEKKMLISDFIVVRRLRQGNFGKVYSCWNSKTKKIYAVKVLDRQNIEQSQIIQYVMNQEQILRTVPRHPFIVGFHKLVKDSNFIYFIMELIEGQDLFDVITKVNIFTPENTRFLVSQILLMMEHMHGNRIIYRDLKPQNLMMNTNGYLTLVDMGTAKKLKIEKRFKTSTVIGTPHYMAPQIVTGKGYSFPVDLWSLGVVTYELLCGKLPFGENADDPFRVYEQIRNSSVKFPRNCPKSCKNFIQKLLSKSPQNRTGNGYQELKKHAFFDGLSWDSIINKAAPAFYHPSDQLKISMAEIEKAKAKEKNKAPQKFLMDKNTTK